MRQKGRGDAYVGRVSSRANDGVDVFEQGPIAELYCLRSNESPDALYTLDLAFT